jgi:hypothetical protein
MSLDAADTSVRATKTRLIAYGWGGSWRRVTARQEGSRVLHQRIANRDHQ